MGENVFGKFKIIKFIKNINFNKFIFLKFLMFLKNVNGDMMIDGKKKKSTHGRQLKIDYKFISIDDDILKM